MFNIQLLFLLICVSREVESGIGSRKFVYQKDMSEYCRRRVVPSVFLGRQVVNAYSQVLHFSRLELPYSCFVSIRTESGSNIIVVIQLLSDKGLINACHISKNQLLVYEIGETFGGYWGPLPDSIMKREVHTDVQMYTLKTTEATTTSTIASTTEQTTTSTMSTKSDNKKILRSEQKDYIRLEVPIVNVSVHLVPGPPVQTKNALDADDSIETAHNTTSWAGVSYSTKMLPLVQFSLENGIGVQRTGGTDYSPRYEIDFNAEMFTPDSRLLYLLSANNNNKLGNPNTKYKYNVNRRFNFKKNKQLFAQDDSFSKRLQSTSYRLPPITPSNIFTKLYNFMTTPMPSVAETDPNSWQLINDILKNLNKTSDRTTPKIDENLANLLRGLSKINTGQSKVFLDPNSSWYTHRATTSRSTAHPTRYKTDSITWRAPSASYRTNYLDEDDTSTVEGLSQDANKSSNVSQLMNNNESVINNDSRSVLLPLTLDVDGVILNATNQINVESVINNPVMLATEINGTTVTTATPTVMKPLTLVDHESWENMVHAASLMEVVLNKSVPTPSVENDQQGASVTQTMPTKLSRRRRKLRRIKRYIHAIPIENARPRHLPVKVEVSSPTIHGDKVADAQEFQRLIELQDDEIHDRVALRYLRQYVGPALFNICDFDEPATRHVYLFNSSRLVLAITNFTLERMTVVMTPARILLTSEARCAAAHLECQVSGARVCIDSLSACDGVPNCGSYDIYDEDRLMCGGSAGLAHNVCLAAITFLAVLLTILYTVHYWLKRCVPKVSDAFFIYTDAAENVLFLDPVMRSPYDSDEGKDYYRVPGLPDYLACEDIRIKKTRVSTLFSKFLKIFRRNKGRLSHTGVIDEYEHIQAGAPRFYSFGEVEINKMGSTLLVDTGVQTGPSLEMSVIETIRTENRVSDEDSEISDIIAHYEGKRRSTDKRLQRTPSEPSELSILKFLRNTRSASMQMSSFHEPMTIKPETTTTRHISHLEEKEIQCHMYDEGEHHKRSAENTSKITVTADINDKKSDHVQKKLRFEEEPNVHSEKDDDGIEDDAERRRRSVAVSGSKNTRMEDTDSFIDVVEEATPGTTRELKSYFWGSGKNKGKKPAKKKMQLSLR